MRVVECTETGSLDSLRLVDRPDPVPGPGQVLLAVEAAGVNFVDALFVQGRYQIKPPVPFVPGSEVAGTVVSVGPEVDAAWVGRRALAMVGLGGFAEQVVLPEVGAVPIPDRLDAPRAAAFVQSFCTARFALEQRAGLVEGERVLVLGGGGGVGLATIAVAVAAGARVAAVASDDAKRAAALAAGAEVAFDPFGQVFGPEHDVGSDQEAYDETIVRSGAGDPSADDLTRLVHAVRDWSGGGVDVALDPVGGPLAVAALRSLGLFGRLLVIGFASGTIPDLPANQVLLRNRSVLGVDWGAWSMARPLEQRALLEGLLTDVEAGSLAPAMPESRPIDDAADALRDLVGRRVTGKVVLVP
jgi:NADPH2:quinone reductase